MEERLKHCCLQRSPIYGRIETDIVEKKMQTLLSSNILKWWNDRLTKLEKKPSTVIFEDIHWIEQSDTAGEKA